MPNYTAAELRQRTCADRLLLAVDGHIYNVTDFAGRHPGGAGLLEKYAGRDVTDVLRDDTSHVHTSTAYHVLEKYHIGELVDDSDSAVRQRTNKNTDENIDDRTDALLISKGWREEELVDWNKPLLAQVSKLGHNYFEWVHSPAPDRQIRLFESNLLESLSVCSWKMVPAFWLPILTLMLYCSHGTLHTAGSETWLPFLFGGVTVTRHSIPVLFFIGVVMWTFVEYAVHRWLFHLKPPASSRLLITMHFLFHGQHHKTPMDAGRLVFPPAPALALGLCIYAVFLSVFPNGMANAVCSGVVLGYIIYDLIHYYLHHGSPAMPYFKRLKHYHVQHHFVNQQKAFGISTKFWDYPFGTSMPE